jgi:hypothetical protein
MRVRALGKKRLVQEEGLGCGQLPIPGGELLCGNVRARNA